MSPCGSHRASRDTGAREAVRSPHAGLEGVDVDGVAPSTAGHRSPRSVPTWPPASLSGPARAFPETTRPRDRRAPLRPAGRHGEARGARRGWAPRPSVSVDAGAWELVVTTAVSADITPSSTVNIPIRGRRPLSSGLRRPAPEPLPARLTRVLASPGNGTETTRNHELHGRPHRRDHRRPAAGEAGGADGVGAKGAGQGGFDNKALRDWANGRPLSMADWANIRPDA